MKKILALLVMCLGVSVPAWADSAFNPTKPVKIVVPFPPGGGTDAVTRILAEKLAQLW